MTAIPSFQPADGNHPIRPDSLIRGDCLEVLPSIPDGSVDMVLADLPFGITGQQWDTPVPIDDLWPQLKRVCKHNAAMLFFGTGLFAADLMTSNRKMCRNKLVWVKPRATNHMNANKMHMRAFEEILVFYRKLPTFNPQRRQGFKPYARDNEKLNHKYRSQFYMGKKPTNSSSLDGRRCPIDVLNFNRANDEFRSTHHPTEKPLELLRYLIRTYTNPGETVLDPTCGSGSTCVAAALEGRRYIGIEKSGKYIEIARQRLESETEAA